MLAPTTIDTAPRGSAPAPRRGRRRAPRAVHALVPVLLAFVALLSSGCFRGEFAFEVNEDGSGTLSVLMALEEETLEALASFDDSGGISADAPFEIDPSELPPGARVEPYEEDGFRGSRVIIEFGPGDDVLASLRGTLEESLDEESLGEPDSATDPFESLILERTTDPEGWRFEARLSESDFGGDAEDDAFANLFLGDSSFVVRVKLPGHAGESNADRVDDGEFQWDLDLAGETRTTLVARSETSSGDGGGLNVGVIVAVIALAAAVGIGATVLLRRAQAARS